MTKIKVAEQPNVCNWTMPLRSTREDGFSLPTPVCIPPTLAANDRTQARRLIAWLLLVIGLLGAAPAYATRGERMETLAKQFFPAADRVGSFEGDPRAAAVFQASRLLGYVFLTDDIVKIPAYSGKPISTLVGIDTEARLTGLEIVRHEEPILLVGITETDLRSYVDQYPGVNVIDQTVKIGGEDRAGYVSIDGISGATITVMVLNASIARASERIVASRGLPLASDTAAHFGTGDTVGVTPPAAEEGEGPEPIWEAAWRLRTGHILILCVGLAVLGTILILQDWIARRPVLVKRLRTGYLIYTLFFIGWYALGQLSVINVFTFAGALMGDFQWETFLIDPMLFILWSFVAVAILLWGRGVYCGWLCPFGALQELTNNIAVRFRLRQFPIPALVHDRLVAIKYIILLALFALSLQSMSAAVTYAEVEPFKTAINMHFLRPWPFAIYAFGLVAISAFNGKFFCKYLCPLGAALAISSHFSIFSWLRRRRECGRPCQTCAVECPSQAIRPTGEIDANECHYCLDCQVTYWNRYKCPPLVELRKRAERRGQPLKLR